MLEQGKINQQENNKEDKDSQTTTELGENKGIKHTN